MSRESTTQTAQTIARDVLVDLRAEAEALRARDLDGASEGASGAWLASLWDRIRGAAGGPIAVPSYQVAHMELSLRRGAYQGPPTVVADLEGTVVVSTHGQSTRQLVARADPQSFRRTLELVLEGQRYLIVGSTGGVTAQAAPPSASSAGGSLGGTRFDDVASQVGLTFRHGAFRSGMSTDATAMMGGGLCWLDYDSDGWLDLFVVNSYADVDISASEERGGLPRSALYRNVGGRFEDVSSRTGADLPLRGNGCVAADLNLDGHTDIYVTSAGYNVPTDGYDALLWNDGDGTFTEGAAKAGIAAPGWHSAAAVGDVDGNGTAGRLRDRPMPTRTSGSSRRPASRRTTFRSATCSTSTSARTTRVARGSGRSPRLPASSGSSSDTGSARCSPTSTATDDSTCMSRTTPIRTSSTGTSR